MGGKKFLDWFQNLAAGRLTWPRVLLSLLFVSLCVWKLDVLLKTITGPLYSKRHVSPYYMNKSLPISVQGQYDSDYKTILLWTSWFGNKAWDIGLGADRLSDRKCPEKRCEITIDRNKLNTADMVMFHSRDLGVGADSIPTVHPSGQRWVFFTHESPLHSYGGGLNFTKLNNIFNTTMTYMRNSDIVVPYGMYKNRSVIEKNFQFDLSNKTLLILWFVSNCQSKRAKLAKELQKHVSVDIYGACGTPDPCIHGNRNVSCIKQLKNRYKFYLAFENSKCKDYITEKVWMNWKYGMVPIVMGPDMEDYQALAPPDSYIHVDNFTSVEALAKYVSYLDKNDQAYLRYHTWRRYYTAGNDIEMHEDRWCKLCKAAHQRTTSTKTHSISEFWSAKKLFQTK